MLATIGLLAVLLVVGSPPIARLAIALPAAGAAIGYLQAYLRFCVAFGFRGVLNFGPLGEQQSVADEASHARDRRQALIVTAVGAAVGLAVGAVAFLLPA